MNWEKAFQIFTQPFVTLGKTPVTVATVVQFVIMLVVVVLAARLIRRLLRDRLLARTKLDPGLRDAIARITGYVVLGLGIMMSLQTVGIEMSSLNVLAGALGVGLGFGLRNIVENFVSGLIILGERPIRVGDRIEVGSSAGRVVAIGARSTVIRTNDDISIIIPNSDFIKEKVINWSHGFPRLRFRIPIGVAFDSDVRLVETLLLEIGKNAEGALENPPPSVCLIRFGDSSIDFELRVWTSEMMHNPGRFKSKVNSRFGKNSKSTTLNFLTCNAICISASHCAWRWRTMEPLEAKGMNRMTEQRQQSMGQQSRTGGDCRPLSPCSRHTTQTYLFTDQLRAISNGHLIH